MERLLKLYKDRFGCEPADVSLLPLSGSARKYYRMSGDGTSVIGCIGTNPRENRAFLTIDARMCAEGIHAPAVYGVSPDGMAYIQQDLGGGQLFELLKPSIGTGSFSEEEKGWLHAVMAALPAIQYRTGKDFDWSVCFPDRGFNARMVDFDLNYFKYCFLKETGLEFDEIRLQDDFDTLREDSLKGFGDTFMYRDFQARNVMILDGEPWFIDFQGGRRGPVQYDLASFLWNAGTHFSADMRKELEGTYLQALSEFEPVSRDLFYERYRLITLVRLLQEFGAYGFRGLIERKQLFIDCIAPAQKVLSELVAEPFERYPYLSEVLRTVAREWKFKP